MRVGLRRLGTHRLNLRGYAVSVYALGGEIHRLGGGIGQGRAQGPPSVFECLCAT
jgi:hypothetical protein